MGMECWAYIIKRWLSFTVFWPQFSQKPSKLEPVLKKLNEEFEKLFKLENEATKLET